ncbi:hypothetical protein [Dyadobacter sp. CY347]|nr:hypothetical protein [Dyadobacter sp. CY347]MCF2491052.1 hypothetical protein [Dyadobacter sp. CY347]
MSQTILAIFQIILYSDQWNEQLITEHTKPVIFVENGAQEKSLTLK